MSFLNVEIKARCADPGLARDYLKTQGASFRGKDMQTDTYFNVPHGRLKLREGIIENNLIYYERENISGPKNSHFNLIKVEDAVGLKDALSKSIGIKIAVIKHREIYNIKNVKFHLDDVSGLGTFIEVEAGNVLADLSGEELLAQCKFYMKELNISVDDLVELSYSDMLENSGSLSRLY